MNKSRRSCDLEFFENLRVENKKNVISRPRRVTKGSKSFQKFLRENGEGSKVSRLLVQRFLRVLNIPRITIVPPTCAIRCWKRSNFSFFPNSRRHRNKITHFVYYECSYFRVSALRIHIIILTAIITLLVTYVRRCDPIFLAVFQKWKKTKKKNATHQLRTHYIKFTIRLFLFSFLFLLPF